MDTREHHILRALMEHIPDLIYAKDEEGRYAFFNAATAKLLTGDASANLSGMTDFNFYPQEMAENFAADEDGILRTGKPILNQEECRLDRGGRMRWFSTTKVLWRDENDRTIGIIGISRDMTLERQARESIAQRNVEVQLLYEAARQISRSLDINQVYDTLFEIIIRVMDCDSLVVSSYHPEKELIFCEYARIGQTRLDVKDFPAIPLEPEGHGVQSVVIRTGKSMLIPNYPERLKTTQTSYVFDEKGVRTDISSAEDTDPTRSAVVVPLILEGKVTGVIQVFSDKYDVYTDQHLHLLEAFASQVAAASTNARLYQQAQNEIAERIHAERSLRALAEENARLAEARSNLLQEVNHRVKNNLTSIMGLLEMEINRPAEELTDIQGLLRTLQERILGMAYVHNLLSSAQWSPLSIRELIFHIIRAALSNASLQEKVHVTVDSEPEEIMINPRQATALALIVNELAMNSGKHAFRQKGGGIIDVKIKLDLNGNNSRVKVDYHDDGPGWPEDVLDGKRSGVGLEVVRLSVQSPLAGTLQMYNDHGAAVSLDFKLSPLNKPAIT